MRPSFTYQCNMQFLIGRRCNEFFIIFPAEFVLWYVRTPTLQPVASSTPTPSTPTQTVETPTAVPSTITAVPSASSTPTSSGSDEQNRYAEGDSNLTFEWSMLVDSVALGLSYIWLCCGILVFVSIPVIFVVLWVASRRRQQGEE